MRTLSYPERSTWPSICQRPGLQVDYLQSTVRNILNRVRTAGDEALREFSLRYDHVKLESLRVSKAELEDSRNQIPAKLKDAIEAAASNIRRFHESQKQEFPRVETTAGVFCWRKAVPIERVGIYIPGGTAPLFSTVLMLAIPADIAGCPQVALCTPPNSDGTVSTSILYTALISGVKEIFKIGGAQAIAAMAYGTESVPRVNKIFGPGNQYVVAAKQLVSQEGVAIDLPAGPSEVLVVADETSNPAYVAADLLAQAEHGTDSQVVLLSVHDSVITSVKAQLTEQLKRLPRQDIAAKALEHSLAVTLRDYSEIIGFINEYAPEHLILQCRDNRDLETEVRNVGSVFSGSLSPESVGDYASGTNHTLPTNGYAKAYSGVSLESFQKIITFQSLTADGLRKLGPTVMEMAEAENLIGHKESVNIRLKDFAK